MDDCETLVSSKDEAEVVFMTNVNLLSELKKDLLYCWNSENKADAELIPNIGRYLFVFIFLYQYRFNAD